MKTCNDLSAKFNCSPYRHSVALTFLSFCLLVLLSPSCAHAGGDRIIDDNFETQDLGCWATRGADGWNISGCGGFVNIGKGPAITLVENQVSYSGGKSLRIRFSSNEEHGGTDVRFDDEDHIFTRFYDYYDTDFDFAYGMKTHRIRSFNSATQINDYDMVMLAWGLPTSGQHDFSGINDMRALSFNYNGGPSEWSTVSTNFAFTRSQWYCVETEVKLNTPGASNGYVKIWVDGTLVGQSLNQNIRGNLTSGINSVLFGGWYSNGAQGNNSQPDPAVISYRFLDSVAVGRERIGCEVDDGEPNTPPSTPTGLTVIE